MEKLMFIVSNLILIFSLTLSGAEKDLEDTSKPASKPKAHLEKSPKSLFFVKKAKISSEVGEPQFYPEEAQLKLIINDKALNNIEKYE